MLGLLAFAGAAAKAAIAFVLTGPEIDAGKKWLLAVAAWSILAGSMEHELGDSSEPFLQTLMPECSLPFSQAPRPQPGVRYRVTLHTVLLSLKSCE